MISFYDVTMKLGTKVLFHDINLTIEPNQKICLVGRNGSGKSTLMRLIMQEIEPTQGEIRLTHAVRINMLQQQLPVNLDITVAEYVKEALAEQQRSLDLFQKLSAENPNNKLLPKLQDKIEVSGGWNLDLAVEKICTQLKLPFTQKLTTLSGGWRRRTALARALVNNPEILLLDEPTNHLDINTTEWLEQQILNFKGTVLFISHDRYFSQKIATQFFDIDRGNIEHYTGSYRQYLEQKKIRYDAQEASEKVFDKRLSKEEDWLNQGVKARRKRNMGRVRQIGEMQAEKGDRAKIEKIPEFKIASAEASGKKVIDGHNLSYSYGDNHLFKKLNLKIQYGDRIGIVGNNGVGKTTLMQVLLGELEPTMGTIKIGTNLQIGYYSQTQTVPYPDKTVAYNINDGKDYIENNGGSIHVVGYLKQFLFTPETSMDKVRLLSGGEKNRVLLARIFAKPCNFLILDEPTNDLDVQILEVLEKQLQKWKGTLVIVSHDRYFLDAVIKKMLVFEENGNINLHVGNFTDWQRRGGQLLVNETAIRGKKANKLSTAAAPPKKISFNQQYLYKSLPDLITDLEKQVQTLEAQTKHSEFSKKSVVQQNELYQKMTDLQDQLDAKEQQWLDISEIIE